jgi:hypothetical protein
MKKAFFVLILTLLFSCTKNNQNTISQESNVEDGRWMEILLQSKSFFDEKK